MNKVTRGEVLGLAEYEQIRDRFRTRMIAEKKARRLALGPELTVVFENHDTVLLQIQEMLRTERITREGAVQHEIDTYNELVPEANELSATIFVEIPDNATRDRRLIEMAGLEPTFAFVVGERSFPCRNETRGVMPDRTTAVHYVKFPLDADAVAALKRGAEAAITVRHPRCEATAPIVGVTRQSLLDDLA